MKMTILPILMGLPLLLVSCDERKAQVRVNEIKVEAPFNMPGIKIPDFSQVEHFSIVDFGAVQGDKGANSNAIASAIDEAHRNGGGVVVTPEGEATSKISRWTQFVGKGRSTKM